LINVKALCILKLSQTKGERLVSDEQIRECFGVFIAVGNYFSPLNPDTIHAIEELEAISHEISGLSILFLVVGFQSTL
jgi:hypothetical protein